MFLGILVQKCKTYLCVLFRFIQIFSIMNPREWSFRRDQVNINFQHFHTCAQIMVGFSVFRGRIVFATALSDQALRPIFLLFVFLAAWICSLFIWKGFCASLEFWQSDLTCPSDGQYLSLWSVQRGKKETIKALLSRTCSIGIRMMAENVSHLLKGVPITLAATHTCVGPRLSGCRNQNWELADNLSQCLWYWQVWMLKLVMPPRLTSLQIFAPLEACAGVYGSYSPFWADCESWTSQRGYI